MPLADPADRSRWGRVGAYESWANTADRSARTRPAREALEAKFASAPDPEMARKAFYARMAAKSLEVRRAKAAARRAARTEGRAA